MADTVPFIGRERELELLQALGRRGRAAIAVVYGRRRIGKTELIRRAFAAERVLSFEGIENESKQRQIQNFLFQLSTQCGLDIPVPRPREWHEAFFLLRDAVGKKPTVIILDEFQWLANYRYECVAELKMIWDQYLVQQPQTRLVLCGSIASFMIGKVIRSKAMYGRTDQVIHLQEFHLPESRVMLQEHGRDEVMEAQMMVGGVPLYLDLLRGSPSIHAAMEETAFRPHGYFVEEYERIFTSHFGRNADYSAIVQALAKQPYGMSRKQLIKAAGVTAGGSLSEHLFNLETAGFIRSVTSVDRGPDARAVRYLLTDAYLRFYYAFIRPNRKKIASASGDIFARIAQSPRYRSWMGRAFENLCLQHSGRIAECLGFSGIDYSVGPYFRSADAVADGVQIDLLFDRADNTLTLCEMKYQRAAVDAKVVEEVERKVAVLESRCPGKTIQKVLVSRSAMTAGVERQSYFYRHIAATELLEQTRR
jgi:AAA+ ATPase superfamily predicted ATPase